MWWRCRKTITLPPREDGTWREAYAGGCGGELNNSGIRYRAEVSLGKLDITAVEHGLYYEVACETWEPGGYDEKRVDKVKQ